MAKARRLRTSSIKHADLVIQLAAGLHDLRVAMRPQTYCNSHGRTQAPLHPLRCETQLAHNNFFGEHLWLIRMLNHIVVASNAHFSIEFIVTAQLPYSLQALRVRCR